MDMMHNQKCFSERWHVDYWGKVILNRCFSFCGICQPDHTAVRSGGDQTAVARALGEERLSPWHNLIPDTSVFTVLMQMYCNNALYTWQKSCKPSEIFSLQLIIIIIIITGLQGALCLELGKGTQVSFQVSHNLPSMQKMTIQAIHRSELWNFTMIRNCSGTGSQFSSQCLLLCEISAPLTVSLKKSTCSL